MEHIASTEEKTVTLLPTDSAERKAIPLASGLFDYFPAALAAVAAVSYAGNAKHNPGQPLHWARGKSDDHADTMLRHFAERGTVDLVPDVNGKRHRHSAMMVWRALAILQLELEAADEAPVAVTPRAAFVVSEGQVKGNELQWREAIRGEKAVLGFQPTGNRIQSMQELTDNVNGKTRPYIIGFPSAPTAEQIPYYIWSDGRKTVAPTYDSPRYVDPAERDDYEAKEPLTGD